MTDVSAVEFRRLALLDAIREAFAELEPLLADRRLEGIQVIIKLGGNGAIRSVLVTPELRFETTT